MSSQQPSEIPSPDVKEKEGADEAPAVGLVNVHVSEPETLWARAREIYDHIARRAYSLFEERGGRPGNHIEDWIQAESELFAAVTLKTEQTDDAFTVYAWMPAFHASQIQVWAGPGTLVIAGRSEEKSERTHSGALYSEEEYRESFSSLDIPDDLDLSKATAKFEKGVLEVVLPVGRPAEPVEVKVE